MIEQKGTGDKVRILLERTKPDLCSASKMLQCWYLRVIHYRQKVGLVLFVVAFVARNKCWPWRRCHEPVSCPNSPPTESLKTP